MQNTATIGHNNPPEHEELAEKVKRLYPETFKTFEDLIFYADVIPEEIKDEQEAGKVGDFIKQITANQKSFKAIHKEEKEPHLRAGRTVDNFFKIYIEKLDRILEKVKPVQGAYVARKEEEARRKREEAAEKARIEAEERLAEAKRKEEEAERLRKQREEEARRAAEEAARKQKEFEEKAAAERKRHEEEKAAIEAKARAEQEAKQAEIDRLKAEAAAKEEQDRADKQRLKQLEDEKKAAEKEAARKAKELEDQQKEKERALREEQRGLNKEARENEKAITELGRAANLQEREAGRDLEKAVKLEKQADRIENTASAAAQKEARVRGFGGSLSTVSNAWTGEVVSRAELDLEALRFHIPEDALNQAVRAFVKAGGRELKGASIYEDQKVQVR